MVLAPLDPTTRRRHKLRNTVQTWLLVGGSIGLLVLCAFVFAGLEGIVWAAIFGTFLLVASLRASPWMVLRLYRARPMTQAQFPEGARLVAELSRRAELPAMPRLFYVPSRMMNAFAVGRPEESAICVTDGLIRGLTLRQLAGVLAHEISHIRNGDIRVMAVADMVARVTGAMSTAGIVLLFLNLPFVMSADAPMPWLGIAILLAAPTVGALMQLALSRAREYDADLDAVGLTGDPDGLASALQTLERRQGRMWEMMLPGQRIPDPSLLRTHPRTQDRVARLMSLRGRQAAPRRPYVAAPDRRPAPPLRTVPIVRAPRFRALGLWY
ncbi:zinc metalloprotease HtpX [Microbaculum marinum]|uniref:Zinc metalloprotease HtpX n=1 Tax=Microbaculum marinum TaxID=1764581 RepID=A0AAW9RPH5_9HYPH